MNMNEWSRWGAALLLVGCSSKLEVEPGGSPKGGGAVGGDAGAWQVQGGMPNAGNGGTTGPGAYAGHGGAVQGGTGGYGGAPVAPGALGGSCIPKTTVHEGTGTVGETDVVELPQCNDGLTCNADDKCVAIPDCPQSDNEICVVSRASADATTSMGGVGGTSGGSGGGGNGGFFSMPPTPAENTGFRVRSLTADDSRLYWVDHGTFDANNQYNQDGVLMAYDGQSARTLVPALAGPYQINVSSTYAFVTTDGGRRIDQSPPVSGAGLFRIPLAGGLTEIVTPSASTADEGFLGFSSFVSVGDRAFIRANSGVYEISSGPGPVASLSQSTSERGVIGLMSADTSAVYYDDTLPIADGGDDSELDVVRAPIAGGAPERVSVLVTVPLANPNPDRVMFAAHGDYVYALTWNQTLDELGNSLTLDRVPTSGGDWQRMRPLGTGFPVEWHFVGDRFFWASYPTHIQNQQLYTDLSHVEIHAASFSSDDPPVLIAVAQQGEGPAHLSADPPDEVPFFAVTSTAVYWTTDARTIYARPFADLP